MTLPLFSHVLELNGWKYCCCCQRAHLSNQKVPLLPGVCWIHISLSRQLNVTRIISTSILCQEQSKATVFINNSPECLFYHHVGQQSSLYWSLVVPLETPDNSNKTEQRSNTKCTAKTFRISKIKLKNQVKKMLSEVLKSEGLKLKPFYSSVLGI